MKEVLLRYGLSEKEVEIYLANLKGGECTTNRLSELTGIRRSTVYEVIESLKKKGLISTFIKNKKSYFIAAKPHTFISLLKEKEDSIKEILPDLNKILKETIDKPKVELYSGLTSIKSIVSSMLESNELWAYGASILGDKVFGTYTSNFAKKRVKNKVKLKAIIGKSVPAHMNEMDVLKFTEIRKLALFEDYSTAHFIWSNKVLILDSKEPYFAILIESTNFAESQRKVFRFMWDSCPN